MSATAVKELRVRYGRARDPVTNERTFRLTLPTDGMRSTAQIMAELARPAVVRDALLTLGEVVASDLRFKNRDRSDYLAYLLQQGKQANREVWEAQKAFLEAKYGAPQEQGETPLDPIVTVSDQGLLFEVFSADESSYACLVLKPDAYRADVQQNGTTYLEMSRPLLKALGRMRSYRNSTLELIPSTAASEQSRRIPYRWIRAFGQVQAASTLPASRFDIAPVDLYNVLLTLRSQRARTSPRALRYELVPGEVPRLVLEPWDRVLRGSGGVYTGRRPAVVRTWGRKRLVALARLLPHAKRVTVHLVGAGLPAYYVVDLGDAVVTLALSGWTDSGWAGIATFDLLAGGPLADDLLPRSIVRRLKDGGPRSIEELVRETDRSPADVTNALLAEMQVGNVIHDVAESRFWARPMFETEPELEKLRYRDDREEAAHRLLDGGGQVRLTRIHDLGAEGVRIEGEVEDPAAHRTYYTSFTLDREGRTVDASCTSAQFKRAGLREGPTTPMIALRLLYARDQAELEAARDSVEGRRLIRAETRTLMRRERDGATMYRVSLDEREVILRWGTRADDLRMQRIFFSSAEDAKTEYFGRLAELTHRGYVDTSAAEAV